MSNKYSEHLCDRGIEAEFIDPLMAALEKELNGENEYTNEELDAIWELISDTLESMHIDKHLNAMIEDAENNHECDHDDCISSDSLSDYVSDAFRDKEREISKATGFDVDLDDMDSLIIKGLKCPMNCDGYVTFENPVEGLICDTCRRNYRLAQVAYKDNTKGDGIMLAVGVEEVRE